MNIQMLEKRDSDRSDTPMFLHSPSDHVTSPLPKTRLVQMISMAIIAIFGFAVGWYVSLQYNANQDRIDLATEPTSRDGKEIVVTAEPIQIRSVDRHIEEVGTLFGYEEVSLSSKLDGRVLRIHHDTGAKVLPGELLLEIDPVDTRLSVIQMEKSLQAELAKWGFRVVPSETEDLSLLPTVVSARARYEQAQSRYARLQKLRTSGSISEEDLELARTEARISESDWNQQLLMANSAAATARLKMAELAIAQQRMADTKIHVPQPTLGELDGKEEYVVSERLVSEGTTVRPGMELFRVFLGHVLKLRVNLPEVHLAQIQVGQQVEVTTSSSKEKAMGSVSRIGPSIDRATRTMMVEIEIPNPDGRLKPGSFARARIQIGRENRIATVPLAAIDSFAGITKVFLLEKEVAREVQVVLGDQENDWVEILSPTLSDGSIVMTSGQRLLSDGAPVKVRSLDQETLP